MPFSKTTEEHTEIYWTEHFEKFLKPLIEENPLLQTRRSEPLRENISREIINNLYHSSIVIADLTDYNPNVFWELGVRQSFKHGTITISEEGTTLPFHISTKGCLFYSKKKFSDENFKNKLQKALHDCLLNPNKSDSIVLESLTGRGTLFQTFLRDESIRRLDGLLYDCGWNDNIIDDCYKNALINLSRKLALKSESTMPLLRTASVELLLTNRYIDADAEFYKLANTYWFVAWGINKKLEFWLHNHASAERDLITLVPDARKVSTEFENEVKKIRDKLIKEY
jgi:hypothetical protein